MIRSPAARLLASAWLSVLLCAACERTPEMDTSRPVGLKPDVTSEAPMLVEGREAYETYCVGCHGVAGDGRGPSAGFMHPRPRNFQNALFKFSSARAGQLPTDDDLRRSIVEGLRGSAMPPWRFLPERTVTALIAYIKTFSPRWRERGPGAPIPVVADPYRRREDKSQAIARGEAVYHGFATCWTCHPAYVSTERINEYLVSFENPPRDAFRDDLFHAEVKPNKEGELIYPPDFRRDPVRSGSEADDLYRSIAAGITGTAMPTWVDSMEYTTSDGRTLASQSDLWALAYYVQRLIRERPVKLASDSLDVRRRPVPIYLHGIPPPASPEQEEETPSEFFEEDGGDVEYFEE